MQVFSVSHQSVSSKRICWSLIKSVAIYKILHMKETNYSLRAHKDIILHWISIAMVKWRHVNWSLKKQSFQSSIWVMHSCSSLTHKCIRTHWQKKFLVMKSEQAGALINKMFSMSNKMFSTSIANHLIS